jgi:hypothetical protein
MYFINMDNSQVVTCRAMPCRHDAETTKQAVRVNMVRQSQQACRKPSSTPCVKAT